MFVNILLLIVGMFLLIKGADFFVEGSSRIAKALKIPPLIIGLTLVSIGTSAPEISVNVNSAIQGLNDMQIGNVVGSNIFNTLLIIGISSLIIPLTMDREVRRFNLPILVIVYLIFILFVTVITPLKLDLAESIILLVLTFIYIGFLIYRAKRINKKNALAQKILQSQASLEAMPQQETLISNSTQPSSTQHNKQKKSTKKTSTKKHSSQNLTIQNKPELVISTQEISSQELSSQNASLQELSTQELNLQESLPSKQVEKPKKEKPLWLCIILAVTGLTGVIFGGTLVVNNASSFAKSLGMSESLVALTIVSIGTSLPELVTSIVASVKKEDDIAIGNVIGSSIFNVILILGLSSTIAPLTISTFAIIDIVVMIASTLIIFAISLFSKKITRLEGAILVLLYISYFVYIIIRN